MEIQNVKFDVFIKGESVDLVVLNEEVVKKTNWYNWFNNEQITENMQKHYFPNTKSMQMDFLKTQIENNPKKLQLGIVHKQDDVLIGAISLNDIDFFNRKCEIAGLIGEKEYQKLTSFVEANKILFKHAFDQLNMHKLYGGTLIREISELYCRVLGFQEEGVKRKEIYKNGVYRDIFSFGLLREEYYKGIQ